MDSTQLEQAVTLRRTRRLSPTQRALLASQLRHPLSTSLNMALVVDFDEVIEAERFATAFEAVVLSSDVLRTRIEAGERTSAIVAPDATAATEHLALSTHEFEGWATAAAAEPLDLATGCYRSVLVSHGGSTSWFINVHHIAIDATGFQLLIERTIAAYLGADVQPSHFYRWVEARADTDDVRSNKRREYWSGRASAERPGRVYRPTDRTSSLARRHSVPLTDGDHRAVAGAIGESYRLLNPELSLAGFLTTSTAIYLHRLTGAQNFSIGVPVHHRNSVESADLIGPTLGVYPVDISVHADDTHRTLHRRIARALMTTLGNADPTITAPGDYDAVVNVIPNVVPQTSTAAVTTTRWIHAGAIDPEHTLRVQATRYGTANGPADRIGLDFDLQEQVADADQHGRAPLHFQQIVQSLAADPDASIYEAPLATKTELETIRSAESGPQGKTNPALVIEQLERALATADNTVFEDGGRTLTGRELWQWVTAVAADIDRTEPAVARVGIELGPSLEAVVAIYGCMLAGRSFVPLDPDQPAGRVAELVRRAGITRSFQTAEDVARLAAQAPDDFVATKPAPDDEAYLLFTSGSTGLPKGVPISRQGLARYVDFAVSSYFPDGLVPVAPLFTALTFDLTITTLFAPLLRGGKLVILEGTGPAALATLANHDEVSWCKATPSHLEVLAPMLQPGNALASLVVGGEAFRADLADRLFVTNPDLAIFNEYGPTEAVVGCMIHRVDSATNSDEVAVPIGVPAPGVELRVVDPGGQRVPLGTAGELWIAHAGLTAGYLGDSGADGDHHERSPFVTVDDVRFYKSGDLVTRNADLGLTYLGRIDEQIKVGGIRLDPSEVEAALVQHPMVDRVAVRQWTPKPHAALRHCNRCGLPSNVPGVVYDDQGVCNTCRTFDEVAPNASAWFRTEADLAVRLRQLNEQNQSDYDCLHLLSGGKDSTYALYRLVELGFKPYAVTLDNGFISEGALENCRAVTAHLGVDYKVLSTPQMNDIFRDSLATYSDVCHGCYKTIYTLATNRAVELGIPVVVTGLSRGQLFETRLIPGQFQRERFDADAIDRAVVEARKRYHRAPDLPNRVLDTAVFETDEIFESLQYLDIYRYIDVELSTVLEYLHTQTPWKRPADTGRSSNCLINIAGIHAHQIEHGYHNYAEPYAWDVRLGHKERDESMAELDDPVNLTEIESMLATIGYTPTPKTVLTAWFQSPADVDRVPTPAELRAFLADRLPQHAIPSAFVQVDELTTTSNGKLAEAALPAPDREHRAARGAYLEPQSDLEATIIAKYETILGFGPISANDDFFALGGDSLGAVTMIIDLGSELELVVREEFGFAHTTPRELAAALEHDSEDSPRAPGSAPITRSEPRARADNASPPQLSAGELSVLFHQASRPNDLMYNVGRTFTVQGSVDPGLMQRAVEAAAARHEPLSWTFGAPRRHLESTQSVSFEVGAPLARVDLHDDLADWHQAPFDLEHGPLLRCRVQPLDDGSTAVAIAIHHVSGDHGSLDQLWVDIDSAYRGQELAPLAIGYGDFCAWQRENEDEHRVFWAQQGPYPAAPRFPEISDEPDGYVTRDASVTPAQLRTSSGRTPVANALAAAAAAVAPFFEGPAVEVNLVSSSRDHDVAQQLVGYLLNPLPIVLATDADQTIDELAGSTSATIAPRLSHRAYPFASMVSDARQLGTEPPSGSVLVSYSDDPPAELAGLPVEQRMLFNGHAVADVSFFVEPRAEFVNLGIEYSGKRVSRETAEVLLERFDLALAAALGHTTLTSADLPSVALSILHGPALGSDELLIPQIRRTITERPEAVAVEVGAQRLTWQQLGARASQLAGTLSHAGVGAGDRVAIELPRSAELVIAIVGTLLSGASYVPIDPAYPTERKRANLTLSQARAHLTTERNGHGGTSLTITADGIDAETWDDTAPLVASEPAPDHEAYVIFTSGSTGTANGVAITHGQLARSTNARAEFYDQSPRRFAMVSSVAFDSSVVGLFWTLATGGTLLLPSEDVVHDIDQLASFLRDAGASHLLCVPTLYDALLDRGQPDRGWPEHVIVAGEACSSRLVRRHFEAAHTTALTNEYGPTEATVWATAHHCSPDDGESIPIGAPIAGAWVAVVNDFDEVVPVGVSGQLAIGGATVADGYVGNPATSRFGDASELSGLSDALAGPVFRTGDRCAITGGTVLFAGRNDDQLNVGGARVEPGEIERVLESVTGVATVVVVAADLRRVDTMLDQATESETRAALKAATDATDPAAALRQSLAETGRPDVRLVAHFVSSAEVTPTTLRDAVLALPQTHRPTVFQRHDELPVLPNGKIDRSSAKFLPLEPRHSSEEITAHDIDPSPHLVTIRELFRQVLHAETVEEEQSFFDLGGDSLRALELLRLIQERTGVRLGTSAVHNAPTPIGLAQLLHNHDVTAAPDLTDNTIVMRIQPHGTATPVFALHNLGVDGSMWRPLAGYLGNDHPIYGIADPFALLDPFGSNYNLEHRPEIHETAARYVEHIQRLAPEGPIILLGFCLGGVFGYEVAQQLRAAGRQIDNFIIVLDWHAPHLEYEENWITLTKLSYRRSEKSVLTYLQGLLTRRAFLKSLRRRAESYAVRLATRLRLPLSTKLETRKYVEDGIHRIHSYVYEPYDGRITVLRSAEDPRIPTDLGNRGWGDLVSDLEVHYVIGVGERMLYEPNIGAVSGVIAAALEPR